MLLEFTTHEGAPLVKGPSTTCKLCYVLCYVNWNIQRGCRPAVVATATSTAPSWAGRWIQSCFSCSFWCEFWTVWTARRIQPALFGFMIGLPQCVHVTLGGSPLLFSSPFTLPAACAAAAALTAFLAFRRSISCRYSACKLSIVCNKASKTLEFPADHKPNVAFNSFTPRSLSFSNEMSIAFVSLLSLVPIWWRYNWYDARTGPKSSIPSHASFWISEFAFVAICVPSCLCLSSNTRNACLPQPKGALDWIILNN